MMKWELKHFGLELYTYKSLKEISNVRILEPATVEEKNGSNQVVINGLYDHRLDGPKNIETFTRCIGHIELEVPLIRTECKDDILAILQEWAEENGCLDQGITGEEAIICEPCGWPFKINVNPKTNNGEYLKMETNEVWDILKECEPREIKGNEFIKHNKIVLPETMIIRNLQYHQFLQGHLKLMKMGSI